MDKYICPRCGKELYTHVFSAIQHTNELVCPECGFQIIEEDYKKIAFIGKHGIWHSGSGEVHGFPFTPELNPEEEKLLHKKPPLGCSPYYVTFAPRICELCEAIKRYSTEYGKYDQIKLWATEIQLLNEASRTLKRIEEERVFRQNKDGTLTEVE